MLRINYLFGATSILGWNFLQEYRGQLIPFSNPYRPLPPGWNWNPLKLEDRSQLKKIFEKEAPDLLIHCGGICDIEKCEKNPDFARLINVEAMKALLQVLPLKTRLVLCSSDHVFSGNGGPYDENSLPDPLSVYGQTRVEAERLIQSTRPNSLIIRVGLPIGPSYDGRSGHLDWLRYRTKKNLPLTLVKDEFRSAVWATDCVHRIWDMAHSHLTGLRHLPASHIVSRPELAVYLSRSMNLSARWKNIDRRQKRTPHLGRVELTTCYTDTWAEALPSIL